MKKLLTIFLLMPFLAQSQSIIYSWTRNINGKKGSYYAQTGTAQTPVYTFTTSPDSADVLRVCYSPRCQSNVAFLSRQSRSTSSVRWTIN